MIQPTAFSEASNFVKGVDTTFMVILGIAFAFLVSLTALMIYFIFRYRKEKNPEATQIKGSVGLEIAWTVIPGILVIIMFFYGWAGYKPMRNPPEDAMKVKSIARMWNFSFQYENGKTTDTLYVPADQPVVLELISLDVIHSLYIPAFRVKEDMVPGKNKTMWFTAHNPGSYDLFCAEYCGLQHSYMTSGVRVMKPEEFKKWYQDTTTVDIAEDAATPGQAGERLVKKYGCNACHSLDGSKLVGPTFLGLYGKEVRVKTDGQTRTLVADEEYLRRSVYEPDADIVKGFNKGLMLSYKDQISEEELDKIIEFMKSLNE
jgi:cytochrome c oxidase subunit 2